MFQIQNVVLGLFLTNRKINRKTIIHMIKSTTYQLVIIYDLSLFNQTVGNESKRFWRFCKMTIGYLFYVLPIGIIGYLFLVINSKSFICREMQAPFLLNNSYNPAVDMNELYELRRTRIG